MKRINLLPQHKQTELFYEDLYRGVATAASLGVVILLLGILAQVATWIYLDRKEAKIIAETLSLQQVDEAENTQLKAEVRQINALMADFERLADTSPEWSKVLRAFAQLVPNGVRISNFSASDKDGEINIAGYSPTRELVIELYNNINGDKEHFRDINYPLENVARPSDVQFNFKFFIQDGILTSRTNE